MALTNTHIQNAKPRETIYRLSDGQALWLEVRPSGTKTWRFRYKIADKGAIFNLGEFAPSKGPGHCSLEMARKLRNEARELVKKGIHPGHDRKSKLREKVKENRNTFQAVAEEWIARKEKNWSAGTADQIKHVFKTDIYPALGKLPIRSVTPQDVLMLIQAVDTRGANSIALLIRQWISAVYRFAVATLRAEADPAAPLQGAVERSRTKHAKALSKNETTPHPKDGLFLYGPHNGPKKTREINIGVIGTPDGVRYFKNYAAKLKTLVEVPPPGKTEKKDRLHLANFPGMEAAFNITYDLSEFVMCTLDAKEVDRCTKIINHHEAVSKTAALYADRAKKHIGNDERDVTVWVPVLPEIVYERCRPQSKRTGLSLEKGDFGKRQKARSNDLPLLASLLSEGEGIFDDAPDFHRHIKALFLRLAPTQVVRETTIAPEEFKNSKGYPIRRTQDVATVAWNLATGLYYKSQPRPPWKLAGTRPGVCYIGLVFKKVPNHPKDEVCCAAQMFLAEGDGVVFRGANGPWDKGEEDHHLDSAAAKDLIAKVLETYSDTHDGPPKELFIHGQTYFNQEEWDAFVSAAPKETNVIGVRIRGTGGETKLYRDGDYPVLRGTALMLDDRNAYLWTTGYVPQLDTYIGPETPNPLFITALRSKDAMPAMDVILRDIMGLTKINYNSCNFNDGLPVTVRFARMVGDILTMGSAKGADRQPFKFYV